MWSTEVVIHEMKCNSALKIEQFFGERISRTGEASHPHAHSKVLSFYQTG